MDSFILHSGLIRFLPMVEMTENRYYSKVLFNDSILYEVKITLSGVKITFFFDVIGLFL